MVWGQEGSPLRALSGRSGPPLGRTPSQTPAQLRAHPGGDSWGVSFPAAHPDEREVEGFLLRNRLVGMDHSAYSSLIRGLWGCFLLWIYY